MAVVPCVLMAVVPCVLMAVVRDGKNDSNSSGTERYQVFSWQWYVMGKMFLIVVAQRGTMCSHGSGT